MAFRCIMVENSAYISMKNSQLVIRTEQEHAVPMEEITALLLESRQITITTAALSRLGQCGCAVFTCDDTHLPCAVLQPFCQHSRAPLILRRQMETGEPLKKRMWQTLVQQKIRNQAACLVLSEKQKEAEYLLAMVPRVRSGDPENIEASAAQFYFPVLFGGGFTRAAEDGRNAALNYGYAILRGCIARSLAAYGFLPVLGLHHRSTLNAFNLADDLIEPFRPLIDLLVYSEIKEDDALNPEKKRYLFNCLNLNIRSGAQNHSVANAVERLVQSLSRAVTDQKPDLILPELLELQQHRYE